MDFDVVVIGAGPGGYVAAIRAAQLGMKTAVIEREALGGVCLNWGCIPTKALLKAGEMYENLDHLESFGMKVTGRSFDLDKIVKRSRGVSSQLNAGIAYLMKKNKIEVIEGNAVLEKGAAAPKVVVALKAGGSRTVKAKHVVLATGARARTIPAIGLQPDGNRVWSYREALVPKAMPKSLVVIGSGAIGIEFASFFRALGADVTVVEALDRIVPMEDEEVSTAARKAFEERGIKFHVGAKVTKLQGSAKDVKLQIEVAGKNQEVTADYAIVAVGISGNVENIGLEALGVKLDRGHVVTDKHGRTNVAGLYAIGDVAGAPWLAHKASHEGIHCIEHLAGLPQTHLDSPVPGCTYSVPQIASVGMTEAQAKKAGLDIKVGRYPFKNHGKALASGDTDGFVKTVFEAKTGRILGVHMMGAEVTEMIQGFVIAMTMEATEEQLMATVFPHPTMSESMHEATLAAYGRAVHM